MLGVADPFMLGITDPFMLATTSVARAGAIGLEALEKLELLEELENLDPPRRTRSPRKTRATSHFLKEMSQKRGEMCLFCAKKWFTLGCFTEKTYICSDK